MDDRSGGKSWEDFFKLADAVGVPEDIMTEHCPSDVVRVLAAAMVIQPDAARAHDLVNTERIPAFDGKTLRQVAEDGRPDAAIAYLASIGTGFVG